MKLGLSFLLLIWSFSAWADDALSTGDSQAMPTPMVTPSLKPSSDVASIFGEDIIKLRDPFKRPGIKSEMNQARSDLEQFPVDQFKLVGVTTGPARVRALLLAPDGKTYLASVNTRIGTRGGVIRKISPDTVVVREKVVNVIGQEENQDMEIVFGSNEVKEDSPDPGPTYGSPGGAYGGGAGLPPGARPGGGMGPGNQNMAYPSYQGNVPYPAYQGNMTYQGNPVYPANTAYPPGSGMSRPGGGMPNSGP